MPKSEVKTAFTINLDENPEAEWVNVAVEVGDTRKIIRVNANTLLVRTLEVENLYQNSGTLVGNRAAYEWLQEFVHDDDFAELSKIMTTDRHVVILFHSLHAAATYGTLEN